MWPSERQGNWRVRSCENNQEWLSHVLAGIGGRELTVESSKLKGELERAAERKKITLRRRGYRDRRRK
jgi:hypothetical protein